MSGLPPPSPIADIEAVALHAVQIAGSLEGIYRASLESKVISQQARIATSDVIEKCCNALDQTMYAGWHKRVLPRLSTPPRRGGYYPAAKDEASYRSTMGQWGSADFASLDAQMDTDLRSLQPFTDAKNQWLLQMRTMSATKHTGLIPQKRTEDERVVVSNSSGGKLSWTTNVKMSGSIKVLGAKIDPKSGLPVSTPGITVKKEIWVHFSFEGTDINPLHFCQHAANETLAIIRRLKLNWALQ